MPNLSPIVPDLDGVVLQTNLVKHRAMLSLFEEHHSPRRAISEYILSNGGVRRDIKISHILRTFIGHPDAKDALPQYLNAYAAKLEHMLRSAPTVPGVEAFLASDRVFYLSSSAPEPEIELQLRSRGLWSRFRKIFGASKPKAMALADVGEEAGARPVFFGDSMSDLEAAREAGAFFVAVAFERDNFVRVPVVKLLDFTSLKHVRYCINAASQAKL